jgi:hypothetical protein
MRLELGLQRDHAMSASEAISPAQSPIDHPASSPRSRAGAKHRVRQAQIGATGRGLKLHVRRVTLLLFNLLVNNTAVFWLVGRVNKLGGGFIKTVFLAYPACDEYSLAYLYPSDIPRIRWAPRPVGFFIQNGKVGLILIATATDAHYRDEANRANMTLLAERLERVRRLVGAEQKTFAGILPGVLNQHGIIQESPETEVAVMAVCRAVDEVRRLEGLPPDCPVVVVGGRGFVGRRVVEAMAGQPVYSIDRVDGQPSTLPQELTDQPVIVLNVAVYGAIDQYVSSFWKQAVLLNEVYPEPSAEALQKLSEIGCAAYHVVGVKAIAVPPFPRTYRGGVPCCAACPAPDLGVIVKAIP